MESSGEHPIDSMQILLVEDNAGDADLVRIACKEYLGSYASITHVETLAAALDALKSKTYGLVMADLGLPDALGIDVLQRLFAVPNVPPILVLTGNNDERLGVRALLLGARDYIVKGRVDGEAMAGKIVKYGKSPRAPMPGLARPRR